MKKLSMAAIALMMGSTAALASGPSVVIVEPMIYVQPAPSFSWGGAYAGASLTYDNVTADDLTFGDGPFDVRGGGLSGFAGYNVQHGNLVFGGEIALGMSTADGMDGEYMLPLEMRNSIELRGRLGFAAGRVMPYVALGVISSLFRADHEGDGLAVDMAEARLTGATLALGVDAMVGERMFVRGEIQAVRYSDNDLVFYGDDPHTLSARNVRASLGVGWRF